MSSVIASGSDGGSAKPRNVHFSFASLVFKSASKTLLIQDQPPVNFTGSFQGNQTDKPPGPGRIFWKSTIAREAIGDLLRRQVDLHHTLFENFWARGLPHEARKRNIRAEFVCHRVRENEKGRRHAAAKGTDQPRTTDKANDAREQAAAFATGLGRK